MTFGKNKVHYHSFEWRVLSSGNFDLYHYERDRDLAAQALRMAEESYAELRVRFGHDVSRRIPLIIYNTHQHFQQSNVTPYYLPEGVAGLTEFAKGRVLVPFNGSLGDFRTTIQHELVHVFQLSMESRMQRERYRSAPLWPPLWFVEGQAVHWSEEPGTEADMILRDMVHAGTLPSIDDFWRYNGSYVLYKLGQSVVGYIAVEYGEDRVRLIYQRLWAHHDFALVIQDVLGITQDELSERWAHHLKVRHFPEVAHAEPASFESEALTRRGRGNFKPLPLPPLPGRSEHFAFLSPRDGFMNIYTASRSDRPEHDLRILIRGERHPEFESLHAFRSRMDVSSDGLLLFVSRSQGRDEIVLHSMVDGEVLDRFAFAGLTALSSPSWAGDTDRFVFSALTQDGYSDIFIYSRSEEELKRLTFDRYQDLDPTFCRWENGIVWSSDRTPWGLEGARNLFFLDLDDGSIRHLTRGPWVDITPVCDPDREEIIFTSDRDGIYNTYAVDMAGNGRRLIRTLDAVFDPRPVPGSSRIMASVYHRGSFHVRSLPRQEEPSEAFSLAPADTTYPWDWRDTAQAVESEPGRYRNRFSLDFAQAGVALDPELRSSEGLQAAFSDMMGDHLIFVGLGNSTFSTSDFSRNFSAAVSYVNLRRRLNYGLTAFNYTGNYYDRLGYPFYEHRSGAGILLRYPLSRFDRVETYVSVAYTETDRPSTGFRRTGPVGTHTISLVRDNTLWTSTGPIDGRRMNLTAGLNLNLRAGMAENSFLVADYRRYQRISLNSCYAVRVQGRWSEGVDPQVFLLGGSHSMRTYSRRSMHGSRSLMLNQEIRFPLVRGLLLGLPIGNLELPGIQGAAFFDTGSAWYEGWPPPWYGAYGVGVRVSFGGYLVLRWDIGRRTDFSEWPGSTHTDFYIGWNY